VLYNLYQHAVCIQQNFRKTPAAWQGVAGQ
jgi:hypothetical protein